MKKTAKLLAILVAVLLGTTMIASLVANALPPDDGGTLTIHKYLMPDLALAGDPNDGNELSGQALDDLNDLISAGDASPLNGIEFKIYLITLPSTSDGNPENAPLKTLFQSGGFTMHPSYTAPTSIKSAGVDYDVTLVDTQTTAKVGDDDGIAFFDNLEKGYYLVVEQPSNLVTSIANPFIVAVPMTNVAGTGWIEDVHCYPKNGDMSITKVANTHAAYLGEIINWTVEISIPADIEDYQLYYMTDVFDDALTYIYGSLNVYGIDDLGDDTLLTEAGNYRETMTGSTNTLKVDFIADAVTGPPALAKVDGRETLSDYKFVRFTFSTYVNDKILDRDLQPEYTLENGSKITFANQFDDVSEPRERETTTEVEVHAAAIIFNKLNAHDNTQLTGAGFQIATSDANARAGKFLKLLVDGSGKVIAILDDPTGTASAYSSFYTDTNETNTDADDVIYNYDGTKGGAGTPKSGWNVITWEEFSATANPADYAGDTATLAKILLSSSPDVYKSIVRFEGLKQYTGTVDAPGSYLSYYVVETTAPSGFNLLLDPIKIDFDSSVASTNWFTLSYGTVNNTNTFILPRTGGVGTILFTAGGIALIGMAAVLLVMGAKKKKQKTAA